jgi:hypothetical protein
MYAACRGEFVYLLNNPARKEGMGRLVLVTAWLPLVNYSWDCLHEVFDVFPVGDSLKGARFGSVS